MSSREAFRSVGSKRAIAIAAHPDDIEFIMAGTLLLLREAGWETHYLNLSTGNLGSMTMSAVEIAAVRRREAQRAAKQLGAKWHPPMCDDLEIFYDDATLRRMCAIVREVEPAILLTHSPEDYMEDHMNSSRLAVTAAFARSMPNYRTRPQRKPVQTPVTIYHAMPHGLEDALRRRIIPELLVDTGAVHAAKRAALACHVSQKEWLDKTQGMDSYLRAMDDFSGQTARFAAKMHHAEGWRRHSHLGFCAKDADPLHDALKPHVIIVAGSRSARRTANTGETLRGKQT
jgi:LmbE family N-acetylglucosaminyl deacetylase